MNTLSLFSSLPASAVELRHRFMHGLLNSLPCTGSKRVAWAIVLALTALITSLANAAPITPATVKSTSYWTTGDGYHNNLIDGSGLSGGGSVLTQTHDNSPPAFTMWHAGTNNGGLGGPTGNPPTVFGQKLEFDLGASYTLTNTHVWNHNQPTVTGRGVRNFQIWTSPDATTAFTQLGDFVLNQGTGSPGLAAQVLTTAVANVRRVQFIIQTTWSGLSADYVGLSEVRFEGAPSPVPTVTAIFPTSGSAAGGTSVTITGTDFIGASAVTIGGVAVTSFTVVDNTHITATVAAHAAGTADIVVTNGTSGTGTGLFTFVDYIVTTTGGVITCTDVSGNGDTLTVINQNPGSTIKFSSPGRIFSVDGGAATTGDSGASGISRVGATSITINAGAGNDIINIGGFAGLPDFTINGGTGNDSVNFTGTIFMANTGNVNVDLQNDDVSPGVDNISFSTSSHLGSLTPASATGNVTLRASRSILLDLGSTLSIGAGNIIIEANQQSTPTPGDFIGVEINGASISTSGGGSVTIQGKGGNTPYNGGNTPNYGVLLANDADVLSDVGPLIIAGVSPGGGDDAKGVYFDGSTATGYGGVTVTGTSNGTTTGARQRGVELNGGTGSSINAFGSGNILVTGTGSAADGSNGGNGNDGIFIETASGLFSEDGNIIVNGTGGQGTAATSGLDFNGMQIYGDISSSGIGNISLTGTAGITDSDNHGIVISSANHFSGSAVLATTSGDISLTGSTTSPGGFGLVLDSNGGMVADTSVGFGYITLTADKIDMHDTNSTGEPVLKTSTSNFAIIKPLTSGKTISIGGADSSTQLGLTDTELDLVSSDELEIGSSTAGNILFTATLTRAAKTNISYISNGSISASGAVGITTAGGSVTVTPGLGQYFSPSSLATNDLTGSPTNGTFIVTSGRTMRSSVTSGTVYDKLIVLGGVRITGVTLSMFDNTAGAYTPTAGESFTLVENDGSDAITGTFSGRAEGSTVSVNGVNKIITYQGGTGHADVVLLPANAAPVANDVNISFAEDSAASPITLDASDANMDTLTFTIGTGPSHGALGVVTGNSVSYTPANNYFGTDSFTFKANDGTEDSLEATVFITVTPVNDEPVAADDLLTPINEDSHRVIPIVTLVSNDSAGPLNENTQSLTITSVTNAVGGTVTIIGSNVEFHPTTNYFGSASFDYTVTDNGQSGNPLVDDFKSSALPGHVTFTINAVNDIPEIAANGPVARISGTGTSTSTVAFVSDIETAPGSLSVTGLMVPPGITLTNIVNTNGVITADVGADLGTLPGPYVVTLQVSDGTDSATDSFTVNVSATLLASLSGGSLTIQDASGVNNNITATIVGSDLVFTDSIWPFTTSVGVVSNGGHTLTVPLASLTGPIIINGAGGDDTLTVDLSNGNFISNGITFNGGANGAGGDAVVIIGDDQGTTTYDYTNANDGSVAMSNYGTVNYTGLEPITNTGTVTDVVFNLPAGGSAATLGNGVSNVDGIMRLSGATFETTDFSVPLNSLTINTGDVTDTLNITTSECTTNVTAGSLANPFDTITAGAGSLMSPDADGFVSLYATNMTLNGTILSPAESFFTARADSLSIGGTASITMKTATIATISSGRVLTIGAFPFALQLFDAGLDRIFCSTLNIGDAADTGTILFLENLTRAASTTMNVSSMSNIGVSDGKINTGGGNLTLNPGSEVNFQGAPAGGATFDVDVGINTLSFASGIMWRPSIRGTAIEGGAGGYEQLKLKGKVTLTGVTLDPTTDAYVPNDGETFVLIDNDGADTVTGIFFNSDGVTPLPQGGYIDNFIGSGLRARITYVGGDGNDVVLTALAPQIDVQQPAGTSLTDGGPAIDFGTSSIGTGVTKTFTLANTGHDDLIINGIDNNGPDSGDFIVGAPGSLTVAPGGSTTFTVTFNPTAVGARTDTINIDTNSSNNSYFQIDLTGTGNAAAFYTLTSDVDIAHSETTGGATLGTWGSLRSGAVMSSAGSFAFRAHLNTVGGVTQDDFQGIWKSPAGTSAAHVLAVRSSGLAPDSSNALFDVLPFNPTINNNAELSFASFLRVNSGDAPNTVTTSSDNGVWSEIGGHGLHLLVREGEEVTGGIVTSAARDGWIASSDNGYAAFSVKLSTADGPSSAILRANVAGTPSVLSLATIAQEGAPAPGLSGAASDGFFGPLWGNASNPRMDSLGNLAFVGLLDDNRQGIYYQPVAGALQAVARLGDTVSGDTMVLLDRPTLSPSTIAFRAFTNNGQGVWKCDTSSPSTITPVARTGDTSAQIPSIPAGSKLWSVFAPFSNATGHIAFRVSLMDASNNETRAVMANTGATSTLRLIAKPGDAAPGTAGNFVSFDHPVIGDGDQAAFLASTTDGVVGLWKEAPGGGSLSLVLKIGQTLSIGGGSETIRELLLPGSDSNDRKYEIKSMAASGRLMVFINYDSGKSGLYISTP